jgi:hypothetical protein
MGGLAKSWKHLLTYRVSTQGCTNDNDYENTGFSLRMPAGVWGLHIRWILEVSFTSARSTPGEDGHEDARWVIFQNLSTDTAGDLNAPASS